MQILGLDISGGYATAAILSDSDDRSIEAIKHQPTFEVNSTHSDLSALMECKFDIALMEPTGGHFEQIFIDWLTTHNRPYLYINANKLKVWRTLHGIPKTDIADAIAIALYGLEYADNPRYFIPPCQLPELRQLWLQRERFSKLQTQYINRIRKELAHDFPEKAEASFDRNWGEEPMVFLQWLAGRQSPQYSPTYTKLDKELHGGIVKRKATGKMEEIPGTCGRKPSPFLKFMAQHLLECERYSLEIEQQIDQILSEERFKPYMKAFASVGLTPYVSSVWLTRIYPFERFLDTSGKPIIERRPSRKSGKLCTYNKSLSQFKACLGAGTIEDTSGSRQKGYDKRKGWQKRRIEKSDDQHTEVAIGDRQSRKAFFLWFYSMVQMGALARMKQPPPQQERILAKYERLKSRELKSNMYQRACNLEGYVAKIVFAELLQCLKEPVH